MTKNTLSIFMLTFLIGFVTTPTVKKDETLSFEAATAILKKMPTPPIEEKAEEKITAEPFDWKEESPKSKIKLLETGEGFHGDEINAKNGEMWLGLFKENDKYFLRFDKLSVRRTRDRISDEEKGEKTGKSVATNEKNPSVFLLKNAKTLREGQIKTVFYSSDYDETNGLKNNSQRDFDFNGEKYSLRVENDTNSSEFLTEGSKLILSRNGKEQVLNFLDEGCNDCSWSLFWVGDLDRDGKLDFYFDLSWHYNVTDKRLYLSSQAEKGKLVKYVANFETSGC
jgi:hypothetical protein